MATEGNAGSFRIEVEDGTAAGIEHVLRSVAAMQAKADKLTTKASGAAAANAKAEAEAVKKAAKTQADATAAAAKAAAVDAQHFDKLSNATQQLAGSMGAVPGPVSAVGGALSALIPGAGAVIGLLTAGAAAFDAYATAQFEAEKASKTLQISISGARAAFGGLVTDLDLAKLGNKAYALGVVKDGKEFEAIAKGVAKIAMDLGEDATVLLDNAVTAVGRQSALILDNLGIILDQAKAEKIYAESVGRSVEALTAYEKSIAFAKAAKILLKEAGEQEQAQIEGTGIAYERATVALKNYRNGIIGFDDSLGVMREELRALPTELLEKFKKDGVDALRVEAIGGKYAKEAEIIIGALNKVSGIEDGIADTREERSRRFAEFQREINIALKEQEKTRASEAEVNAKAELDFEIKTLNAAAETADFELKMAEFQGATESEIVAIREKANGLRVQAALLAKDEATATKLVRDSILAEAEAAAEKRKKAAKDAPTEAERLKAELDAQQSMREAELRLAELRSELTGRAEKEGAVLAAMRLDNAHAALENELAVLEITKAKNSVERKEQETRKAEIAQEMIVLGLEHEIESRKAANELIQKAIDKSRALALAEQDRQAWAIAGEQKLLAANAAQIQQRANFELALAKTPAERVAIQARLESDLHRTRLAQIEEERKAQEAAFARRELELDPKDGLAKEQLAHDRKMAFMDLEMQKSAELDAQATRLAQAEAERRRKAIADFQEVSGAIESITGQVSGIVTTEIGRTRGIEDEAHSAKIQRMEQAAQATSASLDREINAAKGNAAQMAALRAKKAKLEEANRKAIEKAEAKHQEKRKRQEMRGAGIQLLIQGAIETGKAIAAYASYNFVQGALHTAAAALNIGYGAALMSGRIPVGGGGGSGGGGGGDSFGSGVGSDTGRDTSGAAKTPESTPGEAANRASSKARPTNEISKQSGGVVFNGNVTINATGKVDKESAEAFGFGALKNVHSREALA
mgnify:FL=1